MAFLHYSLLFFTTILISSSSSLSAAKQLPHQQNPTTTASLFAVPVQKDSVTGLHVASLMKRTPPIAVPLLVDLNGRFVTVNCEAGGPYLSWEYDAPLCRSTQCTRAAGTAHTCHTCGDRVAAYPGCHNGTCGITISNPLTRRSGLGELAQDALSLRSAHGDGSTVARVPQFLFVCAPRNLFSRGLPQNARGVAAFSHSHTSIPNQVASQFGIQPKFATCLPRGAGNGAIFIGDSPYYFPGGIDVASKMTYAPLSVNKQGEYTIGLKGIKINNIWVPNYATLNRGAVVSTTTPYTVLEHFLFTVVTRFFADQLKNIPQAKPVAPFGVCFETSRISMTKAGPVVPPIDLVLQNNQVWRILGPNSIIEARPGVSCLAFTDGGLRLGKTAIVIGAYQLEDNLVEFDLAKSMLGFTSSLLYQRTSCSNFNFTTYN